MFKKISNYYLRKNSFVIFINNKKVENKKSRNNFLFLEWQFEILITISY
jgi:hypothetical protein